MAPTNIKTAHQTSLLNVESSLDRLGLLSPTHDQRSQQQSGQITLQPVLINKSKFLKATHRSTVPCVCCVFFPFILDIKFVGRTSRGHTGFLIHLLSAVRAFIFIARRIQPFLSLVGRGVEFCVLPGNDLIVLHSLGIFIFSFLVRKIPFAGIELTSQRVRRLHGYL